MLYNKTLQHEPLEDFNSDAKPQYMKECCLYTQICRTTQSNQGKTTPQYSNKLLNMKFYLKGSLMSPILPQLLDNPGKLPLSKILAFILPLIQHRDRTQFRVFHQRYPPVNIVPPDNGSALVVHSAITVDL